MSCKVNCNHVIEQGGATERGGEKNKRVRTKYDTMSNFESVFQLDRI